jgi:hypothetical protein
MNSESGARWFLAFAEYRLELATEANISSFFRSLSSKSLDTPPCNSDTSFFPRGHLIVQGRRENIAGPHQVKMEAYLMVKLMLVE